MGECAYKTAVGTSRETRSILESRKFFTTLNWSTNTSQKVLSYVEYRNPTVYHCCNKNLAGLNHVQDFFLYDLGLSTIQAFIDYRLAPLCCRRDMAMLGLLCKVAHRIASVPIQSLFSLQSTTLESYCFSCLESTQFSNHGSSCVLSSSHYRTIYV